MYVDGFNLLYGMKAVAQKRYYWLDLHKLAESLLRDQQTLTKIRYFTARVYPDADDQDNVTRQTVYLEALQTHPNLTIHLVYFQPQEVKCFKCGAVRQTFEEKMTDVNISVVLLNDAQDDLFDTAMIVSGDNDLVGPVEAVLNRYPAKRVLIAFPPRRSSVNLRDVATAYLMIGQNNLRNSQLPDQVTRPDGFALKCPPSWT